jgi:phosphoglycerate dehydrogenase-like enzyme
MTEPKPSEQPHVLVPWVECCDHPDLAVAVYDGTDPAAASELDLSAVELYVLPYGQSSGPALITRLPALKAVQLLTAGYDSVLDLLPDGVELHNGTGLHDASTAEHALALILAAQRELPRWARDQAAGVWAPAYTRSLADSRVLIVGYGNIGQAIEERLLPFETTVTRVARRARPADDVHPIDELHRLLPEADIVILVLPQTAQTQGLIGAEELALLPDDALVINVGRGPALDTKALLAENGRIRAALDVMDPEPLPAGHPLWSAPGVFLTPHIAGGSATFGPRARRFVNEQLRRWSAGEPLANHIDRTP